MTWIKICGITNLEDAQVAVDAGADALGFVFYEKSPRNMTASAVARIIQELRGSVETVGVFANGNMFDTIESLIKATGVTGMQLSLESNVGGCNLVAPESTTLYLTIPAYQLAAPGMELNKFVPALRSLCGDRPGSAVMIDSVTPDQPGGTGKTFSWEESVPAVRVISSSFRVIVAGGLTPDNVAEAMHILRPWGVDVSSGVEARPGKKDPEKVRAFINAVRAADKTA